MKIVSTNKMSAEDILTHVLWHRTQAAKLELDSRTYADLAFIMAEKSEAAAKIISDYAGICTNVASSHTSSATICIQHLQQTYPSTVIPPPLPPLIDPGFTVEEVLNKLPYIFKEAALNAHDAAVAKLPVAKPPIDLSGAGNIHMAPVIFKQALWQKIHKDGIFRPHTCSEYFWPAKRAQILVKLINPDGPRQTFDKNIRYLAERVAMAPEELLKTNPIPICRKLGLAEDIIKTKMLTSQYTKLARGWSNPYHN